MSPEQLATTREVARQYANSWRVGSPDDFENELVVFCIERLDRAPTELPNFRWWVAARVRQAWRRYMTSLRTLEVCTSTDKQAHFLDVPAGPNYNPEQLLIGKEALGKIT